MREVSAEEVEPVPAQVRVLAEDLVEAEEPAVAAPLEEWVVGQEVAEGRVAEVDLEEAGQGSAEVGGQARPENG